MLIALRKSIALICSANNTMLNILGVTIRMSIWSSLISLLLGLIIGIIYGAFCFRGKKILIIFNRTLMGLPPVVCGLLCFMLFCGVGPLRHLHLLYTVKGMVIAQVMLITPIVIGSIEPYIKNIYPNIKETCIGLGLSNLKIFIVIINESMYHIISTYLMAFSRAIAEVGAVSMVGGAIVFKTNVMTTAIMNYTNMGNFEMALALGIILLMLSFLVNLLVSIIAMFKNK